MEYTTLEQDRAADRLSDIHNDIDSVLLALKEIDERLAKANKCLRENGLDEF